MRKFTFRRKTNEDGFTMLELVVAVGMMLSLMGASLAMLPGVLKESKDNSAKTALNYELAKLNDEQNSEILKMVTEFGLQNIGESGKSKKLPQLVEDNAKSKIVSLSNFEYETFIVTDGLTGQLNLEITYSGDTKNFNKDSNGIVTASYKDIYGTPALN